LTEATNIWTQVKLDPELAPFITLAPADIAYLAELASHAEDPVAWLTEELHGRARKKRDLKAFHKTKRKEEDAKRIGNPGSWPTTRLPVKTQPWQNEDGKSMRFGHIFHYDYLIVHATDGTTTVYDTIEELVEEWSVD
jgi:hypothetical protein